MTLGIDIAQQSFVAALRTEEKHWKAEFANNAGGFRRLRTWLKRQGAGALRVGVESTNTYAEALTGWLHDEGHTVYVFNPERVACYARSRGQRNKTDPADALTIALFVAQGGHSAWQPPAPEQKTLRSLTRTRHQLVECSKQLSQQLSTADAVAQVHLNAVLARVKRQLKALACEIAAHLKVHPVLAEQVRRLTTIKGIGQITAAIAVAELPSVTPDTDPRAIAAWAGLTPRRWQSGKMEGPAHLSRKGNVYLRQALYMPALVAKRHNPLLRSFAARLAHNGKRPGAILGAVSHKLLRLIVGLLRSNSDFNPLHLSLHSL